MNNKELFYFTATCLTTSLESENNKYVKNQLESNSINWDSVLKICTSNLVLPAFFCNMKRSGLLTFLPEDLVNYMNYITSINRSRNHQIIKQARQLNDLLLSNNIKPVFLKGTGNLLAGIYKDVGERMVGDIDFIISKKDYSKSIKILRNYGYYDQYDYHMPHFRHYRRLIKDDNIAAVEIHKELIIEKFSNEFNYELINKDTQKIGGVAVLSYSDKLNLSIISNQINDNAIYFNMISLRNAYDVYLLSKKTSAIDAIKKLHKLKNHLNCFLSVCYEIFNNLTSLEHYKTKKSQLFVRNFNKSLIKTNKQRLKINLIKLFLFIKFRLSFIRKSFFKKKYRKWIFKRLSDKNWYKSKFS